MDIINAAKWISEDHAEDVYNKVSNDIYKRFGISSAEITLLVCYYILYRENDKEV